MRAAFIYFLGLATCWTAVAQADEGEPRTARRVELIRMGGTALPPRAPSTADIAMAGTSRGTGVEMLAYGSDGRSMERQLLARLQAWTMPRDPAGFLADEGAEIPVMPDFVAPVSTISIPMWMRPGSVLSEEMWRFVQGCASPGYQPTGFLRPDAELRRASYYGMMSRIACEYGIPVGLFDAMIIRESRYHPTIVSPKNAFGLTQLMPATAAGLGVDRYSVEGNLRGGASYLRQQLDTFGQYHLALAAYNAGPGRVRGGRIPRIRETQDYVGNVLSNWSRLSGLQRQAVVLSRDSTPRPGPIVPPARQRTAAVSTF